MGVYTQMLIPASIVGVIVFLYGCATVDDNIPRSVSLLWGLSTLPKVWLFWARSLDVP